MKLSKLIESNHQIPPGTYSSITGGYESVAVIDGRHVTFKFLRGVRGFNIADHVTVTQTGEISSSLLGVGGVRK